MSVKIKLLLLLSSIILGAAYFAFNFLKILMIVTVITILLASYFLFLFRYYLVLAPFYLIAKIQGRNFKIASTLKEIKEATLINNKGRGLEELFSTKAWQPILSLESVNDPLWSELRKNFMIFKNELPLTEKISEIASEEVNKLISNKVIVDGRQISISTVKIFLKWLFYDDEASKLLSDDIYEKLYNSSIEYRKEIAVKGKGCVKSKQEAVNIVVNILQQSKFKNLFDWTNPVCYSIVMQPFVISPMINMSDIGVSLKKYLNKFNTFSKFNDFVDYSIYMEHPFPLLERFDESTNTQIYIDMSQLKNFKFDPKLLNFGMGYRSCLGRLFAKEFLNSFFNALCDYENFKPELNHLYSGRNNDNTKIGEGLYSLSVLYAVIKDEIVLNYFS